MKLKTRRKAVVLLTMLLVYSGAQEAAAETTLLPPSALMMEQTIQTGDLLDAAPNVSFDTISSEEASALAEAMQAYEAPGSSLLVNHAESYFYYEQLDPLSREIYDIILQIARDPVSELNIQIMLTPVDPQTDEFVFSVIRAWFAVTIDHPELYWLYPHGGEAEIGFTGLPDMVNGRYKVFFMIDQPYVDFEEKMTAFNQATESFLSDIDRSVSQMEIVKQIHDKLMDLVIYDTDTCERHAVDLAHTAYGVLVSNTAGVSNCAVCDGYSLAFQYLLQQCGIPATVVYGKGGSTPYDMGGHAWSIVNVDGEWYEVDSTWDDNAIDELMYESLRGSEEYDLWMEFIHDPENREKHGHFLFLTSTDTMEHYTAPSDIDWTYTFKNGLGPIDLRPEDCYHVRDSEGMTSEFETDSAIASLTYLIPQAPNNYK